MQVHIAGSLSIRLLAARPGRPNVGYDIRPGRGLELDPPCSVLTSLRLGDMGISAWYCRVCRSTRTSGLGRRSEPRLGGWDWISPSSSHHLRQCSRIAAPSSRRRQGHWQYQVHHKFRGIRSGLQGPCGPTAKRHLHITVSHRRGRRPGPDT